MPTFVDKFNRANGPLTAPWVIAAGSAASISGNAMALGPSTVHVVIDSGLSDVTIEMKFATLSGGDPRVLLRWVDTTNHVYFRPTVGLVAKVSSDTTIIPYTTAMASGDVVKVTVTGTTYELFINGVSKGTATHSASAAVNAATKHGVMNGSQTVAIDDFSCTATFAGPDSPTGPTLVAAVDAANYAVNLTVTGATGAITVKRYVLGASPTGVLVRGSFANGRTVADRDAPLNTDLIYIATDTVGQSAQVTARIDSGNAVLNVMSNPVLQAVPVVLADDAQSYEGRSTAHKILGSNAPLVTVEPPAYRAGTYRFLLPTVDDWLAVRAVLMTGAVCLLRSPCQTEYLDTAFIMTSARNELPWSAQAPRHRIFELDYQAVAPDATPPVDIAWTWADVAPKFATWADVPLNVSTWGDLVTYIPAPALGF